MDNINHNSLTSRRRSSSISLLLSLLLASTLHAAHSLPAAAAAETTTTTTSTPSTSPSASVSPLKDPCSPLAYGKVVSAKDALACYQSFDISDEVKAKQIAAVKSYMDLYPYLNLVKTVGIDMFASLDALKTDPTLTTEFAFQEKIVTLFKSLRDAHAVYSPTCFTTVNFLQPWVMAAKYSKTRTTIVLKESIRKGSTLSIHFPKSFADIAGTFPGLISEAWRREVGVDTDAFVGWEVVQIDGVDAV
ncbi:hypothetical protein HDU67_003744, partial [Dinochytrium kinnereticum]